MNETNLQTATSEPMHAVPMMYSILIALKAEWAESSAEKRVEALTYCKEKFTRDEVKELSLICDKLANAVESMNEAKRAELIIEGHLKDMALYCADE